MPTHGKTLGRSSLVAAAIGVAAMAFPAQADDGGLGAYVQKVNPNAQVVSEFWIGQDRETGAPIVALRIDGQDEPQVLSGMKALVENGFVASIVDSGCPREGETGFISRVPPTGNPENIYYYCKYAAPTGDPHDVKMEHIWNPPNGDPPQSTVVPLDCRDAFDWYVSLGYGGTFGVDTEAQAYCRGIGQTPWY